MKDIKIGDIIFNKDLQILQKCRDEYYNHVYNKKQDIIFEENEIKRYTLNNSSSFHTTGFTTKIEDKEFKVIEISVGGGGKCGLNDYFPDCTRITVSPINDMNILIRFNTDTNCYAHTIQRKDIEIKNK